MDKQCLTRPPANRRTLSRCAALAVVFLVFAACPVIGKRVVPTLSEEFLQTVARGEVEGARIETKFGGNPAVGTSYGLLAQGGVWPTPLPANATKLRIKAGGNANDTAAGSGARAVVLVGLDPTGAEITDTLATAGASASAATTNTYWRLLRAYVSSSGTYAIAGTSWSHAADITIEASGGGADWALIEGTATGFAQTSIGCYTVPTGYTAYIMCFSISAESTKPTDVVLMQRRGAVAAAAPYEALREVSQWVGLAAPYHIPAAIPCPFPELTDLVWFGKVASSTAAVEVQMQMLLLDDDIWENNF
jgi:hypothetical protein